MKKPVTRDPYLNAQRKWNDVRGDDIQAMRQWRMVGIAGLAIGLICSGGMVAMSMQHKVVPFLVEYNEHAEPVRVARADVMAHPNMNQIKAALRMWITGARTVYGDRRAQQVMIDTTYAMTLPESAAYQSLAEFHRENNPYERSQKEAVEVMVHAATRMSEDTWQVEWTETTRQLSGRVTDVKAWQGAFTVVIVPPTDEKQIMVNPGGIYIRQFTTAARLH